MNKKDTINELTNILAAALRHRIGSIVNDKEAYAQKYARDAEVLLKEAEKISLMVHWNQYDKVSIKDILKKKLKEELEKKDFLSNRKFEIMDKEAEKAIVFLGLD